MYSTSLISASDTRISSEDRERRVRRKRSLNRRRSPSIERRDRRRIEHRRDRSRELRRRRMAAFERRDVMPFSPRKSPPSDANLHMTSQERDDRTVLILQFARRTLPRDIEEFFSSVANVRDVRILIDARSGRSRGIAYVEFWEKESVVLALALNGQKLLGAPLVIQRAYAEYNRAADMIGLGAPEAKKKLSVSNLHTKMTEKQLEYILEPFGTIERVEIATDSAGKSTGRAIVTFLHAEDARKAVEMSGFKEIKLTFIDEDDLKTEETIAEEEEISLSRNDRLKLMAKWAAEDLPTTSAAAADHIPAIATTCFKLSNMFDPKKEHRFGWAEDLRHDVIEECLKHGGVLHVLVDEESTEGEVYVKCATVTTAFNCVSSLNGRWFSGRMITAHYVSARALP